MSTNITTGTRLKRAVPSFTVQDVVKSAEYYRDVLGFQIAGYWDGEKSSFSTSPPPFFAIVWRDDVQVYFGREESQELTSPAPEGGYNAYFHVVGVDALAEELRSRGAKILDEPEDRIYKQRELVVQDCNGVVLIFGEDISGRAS